MVLEAQTPGTSMSKVARKYGLSPSQLYQWRIVMEDGGNEGLKNNERLVPESELKKAQTRIKELERALGRKTVDNDILREAVKYGQKKVDAPRRGRPSSAPGHVPRTDDVCRLTRWVPPMPLPGEGRWAVERIVEVLGVAHSNLIERLKGRSTSIATDASKDTLLEEKIEKVMKERPLWLSSCHRSVES